MTLQLDENKSFLKLIEEASQNKAEVVFLDESGAKIYSSWVEIVDNAKKSITQRKWLQGFKP